MKNKLLYLHLIFTCLLFIGCKKDDDTLTEDIYGNWSTRETGMITTGREWHNYTFSKPNKCVYSIDEADAIAVYTVDSLTFQIIDKKLYIYQNNGSQFQDPAKIEKLTRSSLHVRYPSGSTLKLNR